MRSELIGHELYSGATIRLVARPASLELDGENLFSGFIDNGPWLGWDCRSPRFL